MLKIKVSVDPLLKMKKKTAVLGNKCQKFL